jgi:hypothetical protein
MVKELETKLVLVRLKVRKIFFKVKIFNRVPLKIIGTVILYTLPLWEPSIGLTLPSGIPIQV